MVINCKKNSWFWQILMDICGKYGYNISESRMKSHRGGTWKLVYVAVVKEGTILQNGNKVGKAFAMFFQVSISMMVPMAMCGAVGWYLDKKLGTGFLFILLLILGILASFRNLYYLTRGFYQKDMEKEHAQLAYFEDLKNEGRKAREASGIKKGRPAENSKR